MFQTHIQFLSYLFKVKKICQGGIVALSLNAYLLNSPPKYYSDLYLYFRISAFQILG